MASIQNKKLCKIGNQTVALTEIEDVDIIFPVSIKKADQELFRSATHRLPSYVKKEEVIPCTYLGLRKEDESILERSMLYPVYKMKKSSSQSRARASRPQTVRLRAFKDDQGKLYIDTYHMNIQFVEGLSVEQRQAFYDELGMLEVFQYKFATNLFLVQVPDEQDVLKLSITLEERDYILNADPDFLENIGLRFVPTDPNYNIQWQYHNLGGSPIGTIVQKPDAHVNAESAWDYTRGNGIRVSFHDYSFVVNHPDLNIDNARSAFFGAGIPAVFTAGTGAYPAPPVGPVATVGLSDHGTECAGMVGAIENNGQGAVGMATQSQLVLVANLGIDVLTTQATLARGIAYAADPSTEIAGADPTTGVDVIGCSEGPNGGLFPLSGLLQTAIEFATREGRSGRGVPIFWATDNNTAPISNDQVCSHSDTISLARSWWTDQQHASSFGPELDLIAPGVDVFSTAWDAQTGVSSYTNLEYTAPPLLFASAGTTGCSFSAPLTAGLAALVLADKFDPGSNLGELIKRNNTLTWIEVKDIIARSAVAIGLEFPLTNQSALITGGNTTHWVDNAGNTIINANGTLNPNGPTTNLNGAVAANATILTLNSNLGFTVGQAIMIGVRTVLNGPSGTGSPANIPVASTANFQNGDQVTIRTTDQTILICSVPCPIDPGVPGFTTISVQDTTGFRVGDNIRVGTAPASNEVVQIMAINNHSNLVVTPALTNNYNWHNNIAVVNTARVANLTTTIVSPPGGGMLGLNNVPTNFTNGRTTIVETTNAEVRVIKSIPSGGVTVTIDGLLNAQNNNSAVAGGFTPFRSDFYGRGRVDALASVLAAIAYEHSHRDLVIRKNVNDDGLSTTDVSHRDVDTPDIWVRSVNPNNNTHTGDPAVAQMALAANYGTAGPHQKLVRGIPVWIYTRVRNIGSLYSSLDFSIRVYLTITDGTVPLTTQDYKATPAYTLANGNLGSHFLGQTRFYNDPRFTAGAANLAVLAGLAVAPSGVQLSAVSWPTAFQPSFPLSAPSSHLSTATTAAGTASVHNAHRYQANQQVLINLPGQLNYAVNTINVIIGNVITFNAALAAGLPTTTRITGLTGTATILSSNAVAGDILSVVNASAFSEGMFLLIGTPGTANNEIHQIKEIDYTLAAHNIVLAAPIANVASHIAGTTVTLIQGETRFYILSEIRPYDGELAGINVYENNNISYREIFLGHKISFLDNGAGTDGLPDKVEVNSNGNTTTVNFRVRVEDSQNYNAEDVRILVHRIHVNGNTETVVYAHMVPSGGGPAAWTLTQVPPNWVALNSPTQTTGGAAATGVQTDINFAGSFEITNDHKEIRIAVNVPDTPPTFRTIESFKIDVASVSVPTASSSSIANSSGQPRIGGTQSMHCFADMLNITQTVNQAFGAINTNRFRVSSMFSTPGAAGSDVIAYAVLDGLVLVQENPANNTINLIIQPLRQADVYYTKVKYFIYRGLQKADFVDNGTPANVRLTTGNATANFIDSLHQTNQSLNPGVPLTLQALNWDNKEEEEFLDNYFFSAGTNSQLPVVSRGMELGRFHNTAATDEFGFEIVLAEGHYSLTIADAQATSKIIDVSAITDANEKRAKQEEILNYVDPAAFFGMHFYSKLLYPKIPDPDANVINTETYTKVEIYTNVVSKFYTKNAMYIDIRNEHGYSYNYDGTYTINDTTTDNGNSIRIGSAPSSGSNILTSGKYEHLGWPILVQDNQNTPIQSNMETSSLYMNLAWNEHNSLPQVYVERGYLLTPSNQNRFVSHSKLLHVESIVSLDEATATFTINAVLTSDISANDIISIYDNSFLNSNRVYRVLAVSANAGNASHTDVQVEAGTIPTGAQAAAKKGKMAFRKWSKDIGFSYPTQATAVAGQRANVAGVIKLRYYRRLSPNARAITAINQGTKQFTVRGDVSSMLSGGNYFIVRGSTPVGNNHNDGEYSVSSTAVSVTGNTQIIVNEAIPLAGVSGEVYISNQKKIKTAHYHDNIFGSLNAMNRLIPIDSMATVSPTQTTITVKGDFLATVNLNTTLCILKSNITTNNLNGLNIANKVLNSGNTEITVDHGAGALINDTTGYIQLIYSVWKSAAPTRWLGGFDKRFIDAKHTPVDSGGAAQLGFTYVAQTGIALETDGVIFFATPIDFFEAPDSDRVSNSISINGGTSTEDSFWMAMQHQNQRLKLTMTLLKIGATEIPVYDFVDYPRHVEFDAKKENFFALCLTKAEMTQLTHAANQKLSDLHDQYLVLRKQVSAIDDNGETYKRYEVYVNGWAKIGSNVVEREIAPAAPIYVHTHGQDGIMFTSQNYPNLGVLLSENIDNYEEELRLRTEALNIFNGSGAVQTLVNNFVSTLNGIVNSYATIQTTVQTSADQLWLLATTSVGVQDDRMFYWARLHMRVAIRNHTYLKNQRRRRYDMLTELQDRSRGISSIDFSGANATDKKILLIAFDPYGLDTTIHEDNNIRKSSPAAAAAMNLHGQLVSQGGINGFIQSIVLPVRYRTLQRNDLEKIVLPLLTGTDQVDMICTINDNRVGRYDIERFASRNRGESHTDNSNDQGIRAPRYYKARASSSVTPPFSLIRFSETSRPKFLETTLPVANMIPGNLGNNLVIYNQRYKTDDPADIQALANGGSGTANVALPNNASNPTVGSSGDFLFNEAFYRIASIRQDVSSTTKTGHISVERIQGPGDDFDLIATQGVHTNLSTIIKDALAGL